MNNNGRSDENITVELAGSLDCAKFALSLEPENEIKSYLDDLISSLKQHHYTVERI